MTHTFDGRVRHWYDEHCRDLPWRTPEVSPWGVLVSEVMLQQTPAARVIPAWESWLARWPTPDALAADSPGEAVREWGRLGYPRRALRLHAAAVAMVERHGGKVPPSYDDLLSLPGIGGYTAAAVAVFGFGARHAVLDTNVRRVYARFFDGAADAVSASPGRAETAGALDRVPTDDPSRYSVAVMELGALVCTARSPQCDACPVASDCTWRAAGRPAGPSARRPQTYAGSDRQVRGRLLSVLRESAVDVIAKPDLDLVWDDSEQRERALAALITDGLVIDLGDDHYRLPV
jgi:A/G-specific adenine glycosylase